MADDDWYRSARWDRRAREDFERGLAAEKPSECAEAVRIKALMLIESALPWRRRAGEELLHRMLRDHCEDAWDAAGAHALLAQHYENEGRTAEAVEHYRACLRAELQDGHISHDTELKLAALLVTSGQATSTDEADRLLAVKFERGVIDSDERWRYAVARARLASLRGLDDEAAFFASVALRALERNEPVYAHHPDVGLVDAERATVREIRRLATAGDAEAYDPRIQRYRRPDGAIEWDWSLLNRLGADPDTGVVEEADAVVDDLREAGFEVYDLADWAQRKLPSTAEVRRAAGVLLPWLDRSDNDALRATIVRALTDARARKFATEPLLRMFERHTSADLLKEALARALATLARDPHYHAIAALIRDEAHGSFRIYLFWALGYMKRPEAVDLAIEMLDHDELSMPALYALTDLRSERAEPVLARIAAERPPRRGSDDEGAAVARTRIKVAQNGLQKLEKARSTGKARP